MSHSGGDRPKVLVERWRAVPAALEHGTDEELLNAVRAWIKEWDRRFWRGDFSGFDQIYASDFVGRSRVPLFDTKPIEGPGDFIRLREEIAEIASRFWFDVQEVERGEAGSFAGLGQMRGRGRYSRILIRGPMGVVWRVREGLIVEALAHVGHRGARRELQEGATEIGG